MDGFGSHTFQWTNAAGRGLLGQVPLQDRPGHPLPHHRGGRRASAARTRTTTSATCASPSSAASSRPGRCRCRSCRAAEAADLPLQPVRPDQGVAARGLPADRDRQAGAQPQPGQLSSPRSSSPPSTRRNFVPGIGPSPDKMLQGRLFALRRRAPLPPRHQPHPAAGELPARHRGRANYGRDGAMRSTATAAARQELRAQQLRRPRADRTSRCTRRSTIHGCTGSHAGAAHAEDDDFVQAGDALPR